MLRFTSACWTQQVRWKLCKEGRAKKREKFVQLYVWIVVDCKKEKNLSRQVWICENSDLGGFTAEWNGIAKWDGFHDTIQWNWDIFRKKCIFEWNSSNKFEISSGSNLNVDTIQVYIIVELFIHSSSCKTEMHGFLHKKAISCSFKERNQSWKKVAHFC